MRTSDASNGWRTTRAAVLLTASLLLGCAGRVPRPQAPRNLTERQVYVHARTYFAQHRYQEAAALFEFLYAQNPLAGLLQNVGAAYLRLAEQEELDPVLRLCYATRAQARFSRLRALGQADGATRAQLERARTLSEQLSNRLGWRPADAPPAVTPDLNGGPQVELSSAAPPR